MKKILSWEKHIKPRSWAAVAFSLLALTALCTCALAQEKTAENWLKEGRSLMSSGSVSFDPAASAFNEAIQLEPKNIDAWLDFAQVLSYMNRKNESLEAFQKALSFANETLKQNPNDAAAWQNKGLALASLGRDEEATRSFEKSVEILNHSIDENPKDAEAWWLKADNLEILGRSEASLDAYDQVIELNSTRAASAWIRKSDILIEQPGGYNESQEAFGKALELILNKDYSSFTSREDEKGFAIVLTEWFGKGQILRVTLGKYNKSTQGYDRIVKTDSDIITAWQSKGRAITPQGRTLARHNQYQLASSLNWVVYDFSVNGGQGHNASVPEREEAANIWIKKGEDLLDLALTKNKGFEEAIGAFNKDIEINPLNAEAWFKKADILLFMALTKQEPDGYNQSLESLDRAIEIDPGYADAWALKGSVLLAQHRYDEALAALDSSLRLDPEDRGAWISKADALANLHKYNESLEAYNKAIENTRTNSTNELASIWFQKSKVLLMAGKTDEALNASDKVIELDPKFASAWYSKGTALKTLGRNSEADAAFAKAKELGYQG